MSGRCLDRLAARGLEILLALNSSSCGILNASHPRRARKVSLSSAVENKAPVQPEQPAKKNQIRR